MIVVRIIYHSNECVFKIADSLTPYKLLYDNCSEFIVNHENWMNATIGTYDSEEIDQNVTNYYRNLSKLERTFRKNHAPLAIAIKVI